MVRIAARNLPHSVLCTKSKAGRTQERFFVLRGRRKRNTGNPFVIAGMKSKNHP
jgi:hypothetical protein